MGGAIGFTLREESGTEHRMCRWTNNLPMLVDHIDLATKQQSHLGTIVKPWHVMQEAYRQELEETARGNEPAFPSSASVYASRPFLAPMEYGLLVVDCRKNRILSMNHYHQFGHMSATAIRLDLPYGNNTLLDRDDDAGRFFELRKASRVRLANVWPDHSKGETEVKPVVHDVSAMSDDGIVQFIRQNRDVCFVLDLSPFVLTEYPVSRQGCRHFYREVLRLGFSMTPTEIGLWKRFAEQCA